MPKTIVILGTLDTKELEVKYLKELIEGKGYKATVIDTSIINPVSLRADVTREEVAREGGSDLGQLVSLKNRDKSMVVMGDGAARIVKRLYESGQLDGVIGMGGVQGTWLSTHAMKALPIGVPKMVISATASGNIRPFIEHKDIAIMFSVADLLGGPNTITRTTLANAAGAIMGMVENSVPITPPAGKTIVGATAFGATTPAIMRATQLLAEKGYEVVAFHANGACGAAMEELIEQGVIKAVLDITTHEVVSELFPVDIYTPARPGRLQAAGRKGIPMVYAPGGTTGFVFGPPETIPPQYRGRPTYQHNPSICVVSLSIEELQAAAKFTAERLNQGKGPQRVVVPLGGWWELDRPHGPLPYPEGNRAFLEAFKKYLDPRTDYREFPTHINDPGFADEAVKALLEIVGS